MSVEALRAEFRANLPVAMTIKAADSLLYKSNRTYTQIPLDAAHKGGHHNKRGGNRRNSHNPIREAIDEAKRTLDDVRGGKGGRRKRNSHSRNRRSTCGDNELDQLRTEVADLKTENADIKKELAEIKELVKKELVQSVLVIGDGNLTFSAALSQLLPNIRLVGSVLEASEEQFIQRYPRGIRSLEVLRSSPRCEVKFGLDATNCPDFIDQFDFIIWNFPHFGGKTNIRRSKMLLGQCFQSLAMKMKDSARFQLSLTCLQAGFDVPMDGLYQREVVEHRKDSWNPIDVAAEFGFYLQRAFEFFPIDGYFSSGYLNRDQFFHNHTAITLEFVKRKIPLILQDAVDMEEGVQMINTTELTDKEEELGVVDEIEGKRSAFKTMFNKIYPSYRYDISILYSVDVGLEHYEGEILRFLRSKYGVIVKDVKEKKELRSMHNGRINRIYTLIWQSSSFPMNKKICNLLQDQLRQEIKDFLPNGLDLS